jgi:hypothetical protein
MAFLALVITAFCPVISAISSATASSIFGVLAPSPMPTFSTIFTIWGISCGFLSPNCLASLGRTVSV